MSAQGQDQYAQIAKPFVWACVWPDSYGGGGFTTMEERAAHIFMDTSTSPRRIGEPMPDMVKCWNAAGVAKIVEDDRSRVHKELMLDALGEPRKRYVRVTLEGNNCVMHPSEGDRYVQDARDAGDESVYEVSDVWLSEREFEDLPEHDGF
jgi:hypothetical protein